MFFQFQVREGCRLDSFAQYDLALCSGNRLGEPTGSEQRLQPPHRSPSRTQQLEVTVPLNPLQL